mgnify:CR=1 FL=1
MNTTNTQHDVRDTGRILPRAEVDTLKMVERMRLKDGTLTPEMCQHLNATEIVAALLGFDKDASTD